MGFKRTNEGRVFFQGQSDNDDQENYGFGQSPQAENLRRNIQAQSSATQSQIITLLKSLNERLKATQDERTAMRKELDAYRNLIESLEEKSDRSERAYLTLEQKLSQQKGKAGGVDEDIIAETLKELEQTRKMVFDLEDKTTRADKSVAELKTEIENTKIQAGAVGQELTRRMKNTEERQENLDAKVEDAVAQQGKIARKVDKAIEDRARFMRKIERIEETVLQTRDSLNAKAMVLLTDQGAVDQKDMSMEGLEHRLEAHLQNQAVLDARPWWKKSYIPQISGVAALVALALVGGWFIGEAQSPKFSDFNTSETAASDSALAEIDLSIPPETADVDVSSMDWSIESNAPQFEEQPASTSNVAASQPDMTDDLGAVDLDNPEQVERLLEENPNAVAAALNNIETGDPEAATEQAAIVPQAPIEEAPIEETPAPVAETPAKAAPKAASANELAKLIEADEGLEGVMKDIQAQAFAGVPEAQHDLAAVYTAGHGGVVQDYERAAFWFEQAANGGVANAAYNLGVLHHQGLGMKANMGKAIDWYARAADLGHPEAQYNLGIAYIEGIGVPYDPVKATKYFKNAAKNDIMEAAYNLGLIYENGLLGDAKPDEALMWYKTAADQGSPEAQQALKQLAQSLNISLDDVNKLAESVKSKNQSSNQVTIPPAKQTNLSASTVKDSAAYGTQALTAQVQEYLMGAGLYPGPADGIGGPLTEDAVRAYQKTSDLEADGKISQSLLTHMLGNEAFSQGSRAY